jgi:DNA repair protein RadC
MAPRTPSDLEWIELWESIRGHVISGAPPAARRIDEHRALDWRSLPSRERATMALGCILDIDTSLPTGRRQARQLLGGFELAAQPGAGGDPGSAREEDAAGRDDLTAADRAEIAKDLEYVGSEAFLEDLSEAAGAAIAARTVARQSRRLKGARGTLFLSLIGYPIVVLDRAKQRWLHRYGLVGSAGEKAAGKAQGAALLAEWARRAGVMPGEMEIVLSVFVGNGKAEEREAGVCGNAPRCGECPVRSGCQYSRFMTEHGVREGGAPERRNLAEAMLPEDRPREKLLEKGPGALTNAELLAILLRTGSGKEHAVELAAKVLRGAGSLDRLAHFSIAELTKIGGLGPVKAATIRAALELARRLASVSPVEDAPVTCAKDVYQRLRSHFLGARKEQFIVLLLSTKRRVIRQITITEGILNQALIHPREAFQEAVKDSASAVIFVHNHPSGDPAPSRDDQVITQRLYKTGNIIGIPVLDHVIIGRESFYSFADEGALGGDG